MVYPEKHLSRASMTKCLCCMFSQFHGDIIEQRILEQKQSQEIHNNVFGVSLHLPTVHENILDLKGLKGEPKPVKRLTHTMYYNVLYTGMNMDIPLRQKFLRDIQFQRFSDDFSRSYFRFVACGWTQSLPDFVL